METKLYLGRPSAVEITYSMVYPDMPGAGSQRTSGSGMSPSLGIVPGAGEAPCSRLLFNSQPRTLTAMHLHTILFVCIHDNR